VVGPLAAWLRRRPSAAGPIRTPSPPRSMTRRGLPSSHLRPPATPATSADRQPSGRSTGVARCPAGRRGRRRASVLCRLRRAGVRRRTDAGRRRRPAGARRRSGPALRRSGGSSSPDVPGRTGGRRRRARTVGLHPGGTGDRRRRR